MLRTDAEIESILAAFDEALVNAPVSVRKDFERKLRERRPHPAVEAWQAGCRSDKDFEIAARMIENHQACLSVLDAMRKMFYSYGEPEIIDSFLRNVVGFFGLSKGWYGKLENRKIVPVVHAGPARSFVDIAELTIETGSFPEFPLLTALRRGGPLVLDALPRNPAFAPWADFAAQAGVHGFLALPLEVDEAILGGFVLYAEEEGFFNTSTVDYLQTAVRELQHTISEKREAEARERALRAAKQEAEEANRLKSQFLATMSHEIRTPMNAILGYTELLDDPTSRPEARKEAVRVIRSNGELLLRILNDILDFSKMQAGKLDLEIRPVSLPKILRDVALLYTKRAEKKGLEFSITAATPLPETVKSDSVRLKQILLNLISNALKFTSQGGVYVTLSWEHAQKPRSSGRLRIDVRDTGIGMSPSTLASIFVPFHQADESTSRRYGGTGLGLVITQHLTEMLGGEISITSEPDVGSTFSVTLNTPINANVRWISSIDEAPSQGDHFVLAPLQGRPLHGLRILMAEDDRDSRRLFLMILDKAGAETTPVENGQEALEAGVESMKTSKPFDLVLMDMQMPVLDGCSTVAKLREAGFTRPIVALSGQGMPEEIDRSFAAGCNDYIVKPVLRDLLISTILRNVNNEHANNESQPAVADG